MTWKKRFKAWLADTQFAWCRVTHFRFHKRVYKGRGVDYYHCDKCQNNWIQALRLIDYPKYKHTHKGRSVFKGTDDV